MSEFIQSLKDNAAFIGVTLLVAAALVVVAMIAQKFLAKERHRLSSARTIAFVSIFSAISAALMYLEFPLPFLAPPFYELDFSEIPVLICSFYLGPVAGVVAEFMKVVLKLLLKGTSTAFVGDFANFVMGCAFILPASIIYHAHKSRKTAIIGLASGTVIMAAFGCLFNAYYLLPTFSVLFNMPAEVIIGMGAEIVSSIDSYFDLALLTVVPFNIVKGILVSVLTMLLYKHVEHLIARRDV